MLDAGDPDRQVPTPAVATGAGGLHVGCPGYRRYHAHSRDAGRDIPPGPQR